MICATVRENLSLLLHGFAVSIYPRKGTVTKEINALFNSIRVSIYPRKGTVTMPIKPISTRPEAVSIYPRKGTVTLHDDGNDRQWS